MKGYSNLSFNKIFAYFILFWMCCYHNDDVYLQNFKYFSLLIFFIRITIIFLNNFRAIVNKSSDADSSRDTSLNTKFRRLLSNHEYENESIYNNLKEDKIPKMKTMKLKNEKILTKPNLLKRIDRFFEKNVFDKFNKINNIIGAKSISHGKCFITLLKILGLLYMVSIFVAFFRPFFSKGTISKNDNNLLLVLCVFLCISSLIYIYILIKIIKYLTTEKK
ncbi:Plasmodium exported protein, unknown function [Plasmodium vivax]|uniref:Uncharacterized protein n=3 Tax=Plasmodium vivax TaxID=5855 RepID=A0A1G4H772_PLAVI|nr:hypothetical protein PVIIG_02364 [Plasmodium vivax India VII]KMZ88965.1 hypothetical protein PVBG_02939 [Plasmodium vivax Brazil I]SCO70738.1 Plasmodium exported protein, unknown function [Plasmodium vivax]VUZ93458.1 Plasmodium exported protein, unknown function [Plasmodium vivax]